MPYLDCAAHAQVDPDVLVALQRDFQFDQGNPHNLSHAEGRRAASRISTSKAKVAELFGAPPDDVIFTSGATEANNLVLLGTTRRSKRSSNRSNSD